MFVVAMPWRWGMRQLVAFVVFGVFLSGPLGHAWLRFLNGHKTSLKGQSLILYKV